MPIYYKLRHLLTLLHPHAPWQIHAVRRTKRRDIDGLLSVGLKLHCLDGGEKLLPLIEALGGPGRILEVNMFRRATERSICWVIPPFGNIESAITFLEAVEVATKSAIFNNPNVQIQVCTPGRLSAEHVALLSVAFCIGSDQLRRFDISDFETTFSRTHYCSRGRRLALYDASGDFDRQFNWWRRYGNGLVVENVLPFKRERTDILAATSKHDLRNINLLATLLVHYEYGGYWSYLGDAFRMEMRTILRHHMLEYTLDAPWIRTDASQTHSDWELADALHVLMMCAYEEATMLRAHRARGEPYPHRSFLMETQMLITRLRARMALESRRLFSPGSAT